MRKIHRIIFDEVIATPVGGSIPTDFTTSTKHHELLGRHDQLAFQLLCRDTQASGAFPSLDVSIETSCDGANWVSKNAPSTYALSASPLVTWFKDDNKPNYALVRVKLTIYCRDPNASTHVTLYVTTRDKGGFIRALNPRGMEAYHWMPGATRHLLTEEEQQIQFEQCKKKHANAAYCADKYL